MTTTFTLILFVLISQLSTPERRPAAATESSRDRVSHAAMPQLVVDGPSINKAVDGLSSLRNVLAPVQQRAAARNEKPSEPLAALVWVRISEPYLANYIERAVDRKKPVHDFILGTTINGESRTTGKTRFVLHPNDEQ